MAHGPYTPALMDSQVGNDVSFDSSVQASPLRRTCNARCPPSPSPPQTLSCLWCRSCACRTHCCWPTFTLGATANEGDAAPIFVSSAMASTCSRMWIFSPVSLDLHAGRRHSAQAGWQVHPHRCDGICLPLERGLRVSQHSWRGEQRNFFFGQ